LHRSPFLTMVILITNGDSCKATPPHQECLVSRSLSGLFAGVFTGFPGHNPRIRPCRVSLGFALSLRQSKIMRDGRAPIPGLKASLFIGLEFSKMKK
jgi:hypothetical protein